MPFDPYSYKKRSSPFVSILIISAVGFVCLVMGFLGSTFWHRHLESNREAIRAAEKQKEELHRRPETLLEYLTLQELNQFDRLYEQRQAELKKIIEAGKQEGAVLVPKGIFAQIELIDSKLDFLDKIPTYTEAQAMVKQSLLHAYQHLKEAFEKEINLLKNYERESQNISFVTEHIFEITSKDQKAGLRFLDCLLSYRKLLAESIREDQPEEINQARARDLIALNSLTEKYRIRLNVPIEAK